MKRNESSTDRIIRGIAAIVAFVAAYLVGGTWAVVLAIVGIILLATALIGFCPLYLPFGINTCRTKS